MHTTDRVFVDIDVATARVLFFNHRRGLWRGLKPYKPRPRRFNLPPEPACGDRSVPVERIDPRKECERAAESLRVMTASTCGGAIEFPVTPDDLRPGYGTVFEAAFLWALTEGHRFTLSNARRNVRWLYDVPLGMGADVAHMAIDRVAEAGGFDPRKWAGRLYYLVPEAFDQANLAGVTGMMAAALPSWDVLRRGHAAHERGHRFYDVRAVFDFLKMPFEVFARPVPLSAVPTAYRKLSAAALAEEAGPGEPEPTGGDNPWLPESDS